MPAALWRRLGRDRIIVLLGMAGVALLGWLELAHLGAGMDMSGAGTMPGQSVAGAGTSGSGFGMTLAVWLVMMTAMMAPGTSRGTTTYLGLARRRHPQQSPWWATAAFFSGYLAAWLGYAVLGAAAQWALASTGLLTAMGTLGDRYFAAAVLVAAGLYQFTPQKRACMARCRLPLLELLATWRDGTGGALRLGLNQGVWCVGCCWALMALMFVVGVMNLAWMAALALFILAEKFAPARWRLDRIAGVLLLGAGLLLAA